MLDIIVHLGIRGISLLLIMSSSKDPAPIILLTIRTSPDATRLLSAAPRHNLLVLHTFNLWRIAPQYCLITGHHPLARWDACMWPFRNVTTRDVSMQSTFGIRI